MSISQNIEQKLRSTFSIDELEIVNESHLHSGHQEKFDGSGETHLRIKIISTDFEKMTRIARHRAINDLILGEMENGLHAIAIEAKAPSEA